MEDIATQEAADFPRRPTSHGCGEALTARFAHYFLANGVGIYIISNKTMK